MTRSKMTGTALAALLVAAGGAAMAQPAGAGMGHAMGGEGWTEYFAQMDADGDGRVTAQEIEAFRTARFAAMDADGDGQVSRQEFMDHASAQAAERAGAQFDRFDADGDGLLSRDAIEARRGAGPDAARMIARLDGDGDGAVTLAELEAARDRWLARREGHGERMQRGGGRHGQGMGGHGRGHDDG